MTRVVYFLRPIGEEGPVKIGTSVMPKARRANLGSFCPWPIEIAAEIPGGFREERQFHEFFADLHQHCEWFRADPRLSAVIDEIKAGTFDMTRLPNVIPTKRRVARRNLSFLTPEFRYARSVDCRLRAIRQRDRATWEQIRQTLWRAHPDLRTWDYFGVIRDARGDHFETLREAIESAIQVLGSRQAESKAA